MNIKLNKPTRVSLIQRTVMLITSFLLIISSTSAFADATVKYEQIKGLQTITNTVQIKDGKIRFTPPNSTTNFSLYDSKTGGLIHVDTGQKKFLEMDEDTMASQAKKAKEQLENMRQQMLVKMKSMPPEQRQQMEKMMDKYQARMDKQKNNPSKTQKKKTSRVEKLIGLQCEVYETYLDGVKNSELCIIAADKIGLNASDTKALIAMQGFMKRMQKIASSMMGNGAEAADIKGIPIKTKLFKADGTVIMETRITSVSTDKLGNDVISVPAGYSPMNPFQTAQ